MTEILGATSRFPHSAALEAALEALKAELGASEKMLSVILVDDEAIHELNREHLEVDEPTDVLSFPLSEEGDEGFPEVPHLGDIFISLDTAQRQADKAGHSLAAEVAALAGHGLTHLLGYDHPTEDAWRIFRENQTRMQALLTLYSA